MKAPNRTSGAHAGFTLVELIVVMLIITIVAGVALPVAGKQLDREAEKATRAELASFDRAVREYFLDTGALPTSTSDLMADNAIAGWSGPYLSGGVDLAGAAATDFDQDGWDVAYRLQRTGDVWTLTSGGPDRAIGGADDIVLEVDVARERRSVTADRLEVINLAIRLYNEDWLSPPPPDVADPLSVSWPSAFTQLVTRGYLPNSAQYQSDGWGADFVPVGGTSPVVAVGSANVGL